jgi:DNA-binding protein HU-beta/integration host factor subunit beta
LTKKDIVRKIARELGTGHLETARIVQAVFDNIIEVLEREGRIELRNFGVFEVRQRAPRKARNPRTNEQVLVPARASISFAPGKEMLERIRASHAAGKRPAQQPAAPATDVASPPTPETGPDA